MPMASPTAVFVESAVAFTARLMVKLPPTCAFVEPPASMSGSTTLTEMLPWTRANAVTWAVLCEVADRSMGPPSTAMLPGPMSPRGMSLPAAPR